MNTRRRKQVLGWGGFLILGGGGAGEGLNRGGWGGGPGGSDRGGSGGSFLVPAVSGVPKGVVLMCLFGEQSLSSRFTFSPEIKGIRGDRLQGELVGRERVGRDGVRPKLREFRSGIRDGRGGSRCQLLGKPGSDRGWARWRG